MKLMYQDSILEFEVPRDKVTVVSFENRKIFRIIRIFISRRYL